MKIGLARNLINNNNIFLLRLILLPINMATNLIYGISTACTSGAKALISAARLLNANLCDAVICGGVDTLSLLTLVGFNSLSVLSAEQNQSFFCQQTRYQSW